MDKLKTLTEHNGVRLTEVTTSIKLMRQLNEHGKFSPTMAMFLPFMRGS